jgi:hypothetical protein
MKQKTQLLAVLLLSSFYSLAQDRYDTMMVMEQPYGSIEYKMAEKEIRSYDAKGRLTDVFTYEYTGNNPKPYLYYQENYTYGTNDSVKNVMISEVPIGAKQFSLKAIHDYYYNGKQLTEMRTTEYAQTKEEQKKNKEDAYYWRTRYGGSITDTTGWKTVSTTKYYYDENGRLIKKAQYRDQNDKGPETLWLYNYGKDLPDVNDYFQHGVLLHTVHNYLYKRDRLAIYRYEFRHKDGLDIKIEDYNYNNDDKISKVLISEKKMSAKNIGAPYKQNGKDWLTNRHEYNYKNGLLMYIKKEYRSSYIKYKPSFGDRLAAIGSTSSSSSTMRYGDYQTRTVTTTYNPPPPPEKMVAKKKYKWESHNVQYEYDANGRLIDEHNGLRHYSYDAKGRVKEYISKFSSVRRVYGYRNK